MVTPRKMFLHRAADAPNAQKERLHATTGGSKNVFLWVWAADPVPDPILDTQEYFVYWGGAKMQSRDGRCVQSTKGTFESRQYQSKQLAVFDTEITESCLWGYYTDKQAKLSRSIFVLHKLTKIILAFFGRICYYYLELIWFLGISA